MTDAAVAADSGSVDSGAPINTDTPSYTPPLSSQGPEAQPDPGAEVSLDASLDRAMAKVEAGAKEPKVEKLDALVKDEKPAKDAKVDAKVEAKPEAKTERPAPDRGDGGKFVAKNPPEAKPAEEAKPSYTAEDAPARFTETAKQKWASADPEIRGEVLRMQRELTQGYEKHKVAAERDAGLTEFHDMAKQSGKELRNVVREYVNMENTLRQDLVGGLNEICSRVGVSLRDVAAHVMGQTPDQNASQQDATIRELKATVARLEGQVGNVSKTFQQQQETAVMSEVTEWSKDKPLFEVLAPHIAEHMRSSGNTNLDDAYNAVLQKYPQLAATSKPAASSAPAIDPPVQTDKGSKSINGAPSAGSEPAAKKRSRSIDESLDRALGAVG